MPKSAKEIMVNRPALPLLSQRNAELKGLGLRMYHCQRTFIPDPAGQGMKKDRLSGGLGNLGTTGDQGMLKSRTRALPPRADMLRVP